MKRTGREKILTCLGAILLGGGSLAFAADSEVRVSHRARALQPGEVVLVQVESPVPLGEVRGEIFGKRFPFHEAPEPGSWHGLVGIDLDVQPGEYLLHITGALPDGRPLEKRYPLRIQSKTFPERRLTVDEKFVHPPAEQLERIRREQEQVSSIFRLVTPRRFWQGGFLRPVPGEATSSFGKRSIINGQRRSPHTGTDFRASQGTPVKAPNAGRVVLAEELYYAGNTVILDHGLGLYSYFAHLSRIAVQEGQEVARGDLVGMVGATGRVTGPHLHWTVRLMETRVDPLSLMEILPF